MRLKTLKEFFGNVKDAYNAGKKEIQRLIGIEMGERFINFRLKFNPVVRLKELEQKHIRVLCQEDNLYPPQLTHIPDPPICLYTKGSLDSIDFNSYFISIVGTRRPSSYGQQVTQLLAGELARYGIILVSGMAMGIDAIVHETTLQERGKTIAVLGCGVDTIYPAGNSGIYHDIIDHGGLVISEYPPGQTIVKGLFILRNRLISGLSSGVVIIEGLKNSGTLITAKFAAEQGKEVFAVPAPLTSVLSQAPNILLKQGARLITCAKDILDELGWQISIRQPYETLSLDSFEQIVINVLKKESQSVDDLVKVTKLATNIILKTLSFLEIKGLVEKDSQGAYTCKV